jgi:hypothetical protein
MHICCYLHIVSCIGALLLTKFFEKSCATYCDVDKTGCARFVYDAVQEECIMLHGIQNMLQGIQNNGSIYISTGQRLFLNSNDDTNNILLIL